MDTTSLDNLLRPKSVAVVGASSHPGKIGYTVVENLIKGGYKGKIYPINPTATDILKLPVFKAIGDVAGDVDLAVITVPARLVAQVAKECGEKGVRALSVITSGFSEIGQPALEQELVDIARSYHMRVLGPNIVGTLINSDKLNASFAPFLPFAGKATLITQSGALLIAMDAMTYTRRVGFDKMISIGNMADVDFGDLIAWLDQDEHTSCISLYIEGLKDGREFIEAGRKCIKPIIALKSGVSAHGAAAAASHTGSLAGAAKVYSAAFQQAGAVQASDLNNLFDRTLAMSLQPPLRREHLLIITNGGGVGVLATDAAEKYGIPLHFAPEDVQAEMKKHMPEFGSARNPVDLTGMAGNDWYYESVKFAYAHAWTDGLVVLFCETAMTNPLEIATGNQEGAGRGRQNGSAGDRFHGRRGALPGGDDLAGGERHPGVPRTGRGHECHGGLARVQHHAKDEHRSQRRLRPGDFRRGAQDHRQSASGWAAGVDRDRGQGGLRLLWHAHR